MGMDVNGKAATAEVGKYFCRNVWGWHPLWDACLYFGSVIPGIKDVLGHSNDGQGLDAAKSRALAQFLRGAVANGRAKIYCSVRDHLLASMSDERCTLCSGTGRRDDAIMVGKCNGCGGKGSTKPWLANYYLNTDDFTEFAAFLQDSGGFEIC